MVFAGGILLAEREPRAESLFDDEERRNYLASERSERAMRNRNHRLTFIVAALAACALPAPSARAQWQIDSKDGQSSLKLGILAQPQADWFDNADGKGTAQNLFLRRFRIVLGGKLSEHWSFFVDTDNPNLGKATGSAGTKDTGSIFIHDFYVNYSYNTALGVEAGLLFVPLSHNHVQGATSLLPVDYGPFTLLEAGPLQSRAGRDYGVQLRGYPAKQHLEYRLGVVSGARGPDARNALRYFGRAVYYPWAAEIGYFYSGTFQGSKKLLGLGGSFDVQKSYKSYGCDLFYEQPFQGGRRGVTFQANWLRFDGGSFVSALPRQDTYLLEAAWHFGKGRVSPFVQYAVRDFKTAAADQNNLQAGLAWWMKGHNRNLKASAGRLHVTGQPDRTQFTVQLQVWAY